MKISLELQPDHPARASGASYKSNLPEELGPLLHNSRVTACGTQRPSPVQSVRTFCQYFLHQIDSSRRPDPTREHNVVAFGDVVWSGDESFLRGDAFDMDGIHLNARGYSTIACAVRSALLLPGTSSLLEPVECGSAGFTHGPEAQRQAAIDPSRWSSTHSVCTAFLRNVSGYRR